MTTDEDRTPTIAAGVLASALTYLRERERVPEPEARRVYANDIIALINGLKTSDVLMVLAHLGLLGAGSLEELARIRGEDPEALAKMVALRVTMRLET